MRLPILRKRHPEPRVMFSFSIPRSVVSMRWMRPASISRHSARADNARQQIMREDLLGALFTAVNVKGDSLIEEGKIRSLLAPAEFIVRNGEQPAIQLLIVRTWLARTVEHLVPRAVKFTAGERATGPRIGRAKPYRTSSRS